MKALYLIPGLVCLLIGGTFLFLVRYSRIKQETADRNLKGKTWGKLVHTGSRSERDYQATHTVFFGVYEYDTADGQHVSSASDFGYRRPDEVPGTQGNMVSILYNPDDPSEMALSEEQARAQSIMPQFRKTGITILILGILLTIVALAGILGLFDPLVEKLLS